MAEARQREEWFRIAHAARGIMAKESLQELNPFVRRSSRKRGSSQINPTDTVKHLAALAGLGGMTGE